MMKKILSCIVLLLLFACSDETQVAQSAQPQKETPTPATAEVQPAPVADSYFLVFFLDPNGGPCQMQNQILEGMGGELQGKVELRYVQTTRQEDLQYFYAYGVRGLPLLMLVDSSGKEIKRLPPGVNSAENIRKLLASIPD